jgi:hypothetical protein
MEEANKAGWQPIETSPRDGRIFATVNETGYCCSMFFRDGDMVTWQQRPAFPFRPVLWSELPPEIAALSLE